MVNKISTKHKTVLGIAEAYDLNKQFEPVAGPSKINQVNDSTNKLNDSLNNSFESTPERGKGIVSFYDMSKIFDISVDDNQKEEQINNSLENCDEMHMDMSVMEENNCDCVSKYKQDEEIDCLENHNELERMDVSITEENQQDQKEMLPELTYIAQKTNKVIITPKIRAPTKSYIVTTLDKYNIPKHKNPEPYFSDHKHVGEKVEIGQLVLKLQSKLARDQKPLENVLNTTSIEEWRQLVFLQSNEINADTKPEILKSLLAGNKHCILQPVKRPPLRSEVVRWLRTNNGVVIDKMEQTEISKNVDDLENSQAIGLNEDEINNSISLEALDKVITNINL